MSKLYPNLNNSEIEQLSSIMGDTDNGFSGHMINRLLEVCSIADVSPTITKKNRLFNALAVQCNKEHNTNCVYRYIQEAMKPARWLDKPKEKEKMRVRINEVLALKGFQIDEKNNFVKVTIANTVSEAKARATNLNKRLHDIQAHPRVLRCCTEELLANDYFHAVHEAAKSLTDRIAEETGLTSDGATLIEKAFSVNDPAVIMNRLASSSERNEYRGVKEMICGIHYAVRNVTAHEMRMKWNIDEDRAIDILSIISALHKILDDCQFIRKDI